MTSERDSINAGLIAKLRRVASDTGATFTENDEEVRVRATRSGLAVTIVIPRSALEFFIEVAGADGVCRIKDWLDYAGYDATPESQLAEEMGADVIQFVSRVLGRELRIPAGSRTLEWYAGDRWLQAVPVVPDAERMESGDAHRHKRH